MRTPTLVRHLRVRLDDDLRRQVETAAGADDLDVSEFVRRELHGALRRRRSDDRDPPPPAAPAAAMRAAA